MVQATSTNSLKALLVGSFDPPTFGHLSLIEQIKTLPIHLVVGVAVNSEKKTLLSLEKRIELLKKLTNVEVVKIEGLSATYAKENGFNCFIRGVRQGTDFDFESTLSSLNYTLSGIETLLIPSKKPHLEGRFIREIILNKGDLSPFLPEAVIKEIVR